MHDTVAVFGGMHSAFLVIKYLLELGVKQVINFYSTPYYFGKPGTGGLEGYTAAWVKVIEENPPKNLLRIQNTQENRDIYLSSCTKAIYAIGYERTPLMVNEDTSLAYDLQTGIISHHLYGIGIAFPTFYTNEQGKVVELNGFNTYLARAKLCMQKWINE